MASKTIMSHAVFTRPSAFLQTFNKCFLTRSRLQNQLVSCYAMSADVASLPQISFDEKTGLIAARKESIGMQRYRQLVKEYAEMIKKEELVYEDGRRHLANMMGEDVESFDQTRVEEAIEYLLPSGLFEKGARPMMKHPKDLFAAVKEAQFDETGRPTSFLFYTGRSEFYEILHKGAGELQKLDAAYQRHMLNNIPFPEQEDLSGYTLVLSQSFLSEKLGLKLKDEQYKQLTTLLKRLDSHPMSMLAADFLSRFRERSQSNTATSVCQVEILEDGTKKIFFPYCGRKSARGTLTLFYPGNGKISINGEDISYFSSFPAREQILYPLLVSRMLGKVDFEATVKGGGPMAQAGAVRLGLGCTLAELVDKETRSILRAAGLTNRDPRRRERKKPGQEGARRKYTWLKR